MTALGYRSEGWPPEGDGCFPVRLATAWGEIRGRLHLCPGDVAVVWVFGSGGGLGGPAGGVYARLGEALRGRGVASLELDYRRPGRLEDCVADVETALVYLQRLGKRRFVLVGHSFGGAVVIEAGVRAREVIGVAALSSQTAGAQRISALSPRPVLLVHGEADEVLAASCSHLLFARAREPKKLIFYPGCRHGLDECRAALDRDLSAWLEEVARPPGGGC